jgi:excinuclease ABC subunit C
MEPSAVRERAADLPTEPGIYQFEADERVLYVGKAVDVRDRVRSYADPRSERIRRMLARAEDVEVAVTDTETQALLLEANLIKRHQPTYNVRLKDDKSYPLVQVTDHDVPRIQITRDPEEAATVYGPFTNMGRLETVVKAVRATFGLRGCSDHKYADRARPCLDYELGLCSAPCTGEIAKAEYATDVAEVQRFFEGETGVLSEPLGEAMDRAAARADFERAANLRDRLRAVEALHGGQSAAVQGGEDERATDVLGVSLEGEKATVARLHATGGKLVDRERHTLEVPTDEDAGDVVAAFISQYYAERELPEAICCSHHPSDSDVDAWLEREGVDLRVPGAGREGTLVELALKNARRRGTEPDGPAALAERLGVASADRIEGFDVSHSSGRDTVGSNVLFVDGSADRSGYRRKKLAEGNDDYDRMRALVRWRAERAVEGRDDRPDPDLLLIDGGKGQLAAARDACAEVGWDVPCVALAKAEELVVTPDGVQDWPDDDAALHLCQRVRDEAHRFAQRYHQTLRDDVTTVLEEVQGIGPATRKRLLRRFGSVEGVRRASPAELQDVDGVGPATADRLESQLGSQAETRS